MRQFLNRFAQDESAATAIEYGLVAASIAIAIISAVQSVGTTLGAKFRSLTTSIGG